MHPASPLVFLVALPALATTLPSAQGKVWVVDAAGHGDFTTIQPAIDAAGTDETVLVRQGEYPSFTLAKGLTVSAMQDAEVHVDEFTIAGIPSAVHAVVRGFSTDETVTVSDSEGVVVLAELERVYFSSDQLETPALRILDSDAVVLTRSELWGGAQSSFGSQPPGTGLELTRSTLYVHGTVITGGRGWAGFPFGDGGPGAILDSAFLYLSDSTIRGGQGAAGGGEEKGCIDGQDGGPGIAFVDALSEVQLLDATIKGGLPGGQFPFSIFCSPGASGPTTIGTGTLTTLPGDALALQTPRTVPPSADVEVTLSGGPAGVPAFLGLGSQPLALFMLQFLGALLIDAPYAVIALGTLDAGGELSATIPAGALPPGMEALQLHMQAAYLTPAFEIVLGAPSDVIVTDVLPAEKTVWIVDASGAGDFTSPQAAVAAVPSESTLLLRAPGPGIYIYPPVTFSKPLTIAADVGPPVYISWVHVHDLPAGKRVAVRGLVTNGGQVHDCDGAVWFEDLEFLTNIFTLHDPLVVERSADVVLVRCRSVAGPDFAADGLRISDSDVYAYDCWLQGGSGLVGIIHSSGSISQPASPGGDGVHLLGGARLVASGVTMLGGAGGNGVSNPSLCVPPGAGGAGLHLETASSEVWLLDSPSTGGPGGIDASSGICAGQIGDPGTPVLDDGTGSMIASLGSNQALSLTTSSPVREGEMCDVHLSGPPSTPVFIALGEGVDELFLPVLAGTICIASPYTVLALGVLDGTGNISVQLPMPPLAGLEHKHVPGQAAYIDTSGAVILGSPSDVLLISAAY